MSKTLTRSFESATQVKNTREDLIATGIPQENIFVDDENLQIKVMFPDQIEREILEILNRHVRSSATAT